MEPSRGNQSQPTANRPAAKWPDTNQVGIFDAGQRADRRFGALFNVADAVADYGGKAEIVPPAPGLRASGKT